MIPSVFISSTVIDAAINGVYFFGVDLIYYEAWKTTYNWMGESRRNASTISASRLSHFITRA